MSFAQGNSQHSAKTAPPSCRDNMRHAQCPLNPCPVAAGHRTVSRPSFRPFSQADKLPPLPVGPGHVSRNTRYALLSGVSVRFGVTDLHVYRAILGYLTIGANPA
jgi:hypothetical protein